MESFELTSSWQEVFDGTYDNCVVQVSATCVMAIQVQADDPAPDGTTPYIVLQEIGSGHEFASSAMTGVSIWMKEVSGEKNAVAVVARW